MNSFDISASALTAERLRMDVAASNVANADTTRGQWVNGQWVPYQRKMVVLAPQHSFSDALNQAMGDGAPQAQGVKVAAIVGDPSPFKRVYDPSNPDADANGYVMMPNVDTLKEMADMMAASRSYEANVTALDASKSMYQKALQIGQA